MFGMEIATTAKWLSELPADQWCQIVHELPRSLGELALMEGGAL